MSSWPQKSSFFALAAGFVVACNAITGVDDYQFASAGTGGASTSTSTAMSSPASTSSGTPTSSTSTASSSGATSTGVGGAGGSGGATSSATASSSSGCVGTQKDCSGCVAISDPAYGCGPSGCTPCMVANATPSCTGSACGVGQCNAGFKDCNSVPTDGCEVQISVDPVRCGNCNTQCQSSQWCSGSACVCRPGLVLVSGKCVDPMTDPMHCGPNGMVCASFCVQGTCSASCGTANCSGVCTDTENDPLHCGSCLGKCGTDQVCVNGSCEDFHISAGCTQCPCPCKGNDVCCKYPGASQPICVQNGICPGN